jgi:hypothetical protein
MAFLRMKEDGTLGPLPEPVRSTEDIQRQANEGMAAIIYALSEMMAAESNEQREAVVDKLRDLIAWTSPRYYDLNLRSKRPT